MEYEVTQRNGSIAGSILDEGGSKAPIKGGLVGAWLLEARKPGEKAEAKKSLGTKPPRTPTHLYAWSDRTGAWSIPNVPPGRYQVWCEVFGQFAGEEVEVVPTCTAEADFQFLIDLKLTAKAYSKGDCRTLESTDCVFVDQPAVLGVDLNQQIAKHVKTVRFSSTDPRTSVTSLGPDRLGCAGHQRDAGHVHGICHAGGSAIDRRDRAGDAGAGRRAGGSAAGRGGTGGRGGHHADRHTAACASDRGQGGSYSFTHRLHSDARPGAVGGDSQSHEGAFVQRRRL